MPDSPAATTPRAAPAQNVYTRRARYFDSGNAFNLEYSDVPAAAFAAERDRALNPNTGSAWIACDQSAALGLDFPATSPLVLAGYARVRAGEKLDFNPRATTVLAFVITGSGYVKQGEDRIDWQRGDGFSLPGGMPLQLCANAEADCVLWVVTNEPQLAFERCAPPAGPDAMVEAAHFPAATIGAELDRARARLQGQADVAGLAVVFSSEGLEQRRNISPTLTLAMNQLPPKGYQVSHSHNSVAVSLVVEGESCYSMVDGVRKDWSPYITTVTPAKSVHSHHNDGGTNANWLIVQDGGIYYHCRTMGFRFEEPQHR